MTGAHDRYSPWAIVMSLVRLGGPIALGRMAIIGMGIVDLIVVGQFAGDELPDLTLAYALAGPLTIGSIGLMLGVQILGAQAVGAGTKALAGQVWRRGVRLGVVAAAVTLALVSAAAEPFYLLVGVAPALATSGSELAQIVVFSLVFHLVFVASTNFLEALQRPTPGAVAMWLATGINLIANLALVPLFGAKGCAWTTVLVRIFLATSLIAYIWRTPAIKPFTAPIRTGVAYTTLLTIGGAATVSGLVEAGAFATMGLVAVRIDPESMATFSIATGGLLSFIGMLSLGLGSAAAVLVSRAIGENDLVAARRIGWTAIGLNAVMVLVVGVACVMFAAQVASLFTSNLAIATMFAGVMGLTAILFTPDLGQMVVDPALRARGDNWFPTAVRLLAFVVGAPALAIWLVEFQRFDVSGVFLAIIAASSTAFLVLLARWTVLSKTEFGGTPGGTA